MLCGARGPKIWLRYAVPSLPQFWWVRSALRPHRSQSLLDKSVGMKHYPEQRKIKLGIAKQIRNVHMGTDRMHPRATRRDHFEVIFYHVWMVMVFRGFSWWPDDWRKAHPAHLAVEKKRDLGNCNLVSLNSVTKQVLEWIFWKPFPSI